MSDRKLKFTVRSQTGYGFDTINLTSDSP